MIIAILGFAAVWLILVEGDLSTWPAALIAVPAAVVSFRASRAVLPPWPRLTAALPFAGWFFWQSLSGGLDVSLRAMAPTVRVDPELAEYRLRLEHAGARIFFVNAVSLLPGTFSARLDGDVLTVHVLDQAIGGAALRTLETRVAGLFGLPLARG
jgi:multicomponent Na+:H+ antiporter subunit E